VTACRDNFDTDRVLTQQGFNSDADIESGGNAPFDTLPEIIQKTVTPFFEDVVSSAGGDFQPPTVEGLDGSTASCAEDVLEYCEGENVVAVDPGFASDVYRDEALGDFGVISAVAIPYALDARDQLGLSTDDEDATRSAVCSTGAYGRALFDDEIDQPGNRRDRTVISPGDIDEGVWFLLTYGNDPEVIPDANLTGFQLVDIFRTGFTRGTDACGLS
jgi:hypothetical protein